MHQFIILDEIIHRLVHQVHQVLQIIHRLVHQVLQMMIHAFQS